MRYVRARIKTESREMAYRIYITDSLKLIGDLDGRFADRIAEDFEMAAPKVEGSGAEEAKSVIFDISAKIDAIGKS